MLAGRARAYIKVNGRDYSRKRRGFDIVVVNRVTGNALVCQQNASREKKKKIEIVVLVVMLPAQHNDQIWTRFALMDPGLPVVYLSFGYHQLIMNQFIFAGERLRDTILFVMWREIKYKRKASDQEFRTPKRERNLILSISDCAWD